MADWKDSLNLPKTGFPMKANLQATEPQMLAHWDAIDLYRTLRERRRGAPVFILHDGPPYANGNVHLGTALNKVLKDVVVRSRSMMGFDAPYVPGWDCHGLPIELKLLKELGPKKKDMSVADLRRACRAYADAVRGRAARAVQAAGRHGRLGRPVPDDGLPVSGGDRARARPVRRTGHGLQGQEAGPLVHPLPHGPGGSRGRVRAAHVALDLRGVPAERRGRRGTGVARPRARGAGRLGPDLDDHAVDDPVESGAGVPSGRAVWRVPGGRARGDCRRVARRPAVAGPGPPVRTTPWPPPRGRRSNTSASSTRCTAAIRWACWPTT